MSSRPSLYPPAKFDLSEDADLSMMADAVYGARDELIVAKSGLGRKEYQLPTNWSLLGANEEREGLNFRDDRKSGFTAAVFEKETTEGRRLAIAFRGSDELADWIGPNRVLAADGDLLGTAGLPGPATEATKGQAAKAQVALIGAWNPQFEEALDYALDIHKKYGADHMIEVTGHSLGGAHAQLVAYTFGWGGRTFDAPGAVNVIESKDYRDWLKKHDITPAGAPEYQYGVVQQQSFLNYTVNNSVVSHESGDHIGGKMSISSLVGREGIKAYAAWAVGLVGGAISETPLLGKAAGTAYGVNERWISGIANAANVAGDASDRHDMARIVRLFQKAVENGRELPYQFGDTTEPARPEKVVSDPRQAGHADHAMYEKIKDGVTASHQQQGRSFDEGGERIALGLFVAAKQAGLSRIDHVVPSVGVNPGETYFLVEGDLRDPAHKRAQVSVAIAEQTPIAESLQKLDVESQRMAETQNQNQEQARSNGPRMS
ncbi:XVIPCD domain-containing protein [Lysobacter sp. 22409]|uniref:XVIPCD domain-containing protein n=1 Tax=Lysobacter sp. 22409 TaxID=3453917 RepID=UPI003F85C999